MSETMDKLFGKRDVSENRGLGNGRVHLSQRERKSIENITGIKVFDAQDARRALKMKGMRFQEPGEEAAEVFKQQIEYGESKGRERGIPSPTLGRCNWGWLGGERPKAVDFHEVLRHNLAQEEKRRRSEEN